MTGLHTILCSFFFHRHDIFPENLIFPIFPLNADSCGMNSEFAIHPGAPVTTPGPQLCTSMGLVLRGWVQVVRSCLQLPTPSIREGSGTPLQSSCLENPMDGGAWWATQSMGWHRVGHDSATSLSLFTFMHWRRKWQPTPVFLPRESQGQGSLVGCHLWGCKESDTTEAT